MKAFAKLHIAAGTLRAGLCLLAVCGAGLIFVKRENEEAGKPLFFVHKDHTGLMTGGDGDRESFFGPISGGVSLMRDDFLGLFGLAE